MRSFVRSSAREPEPAPCRGTRGLVRAGVSSPAQSLDADTRAFMEPRFGWDFSKVRVHADASAARSARLLHARAFTLGNHIVFGAGEFQPATQSGRTLLAHELAHTVQQHGTAGDAQELGRRDDPVEQQADLAASRALSNDQSAKPPSLSPDRNGVLRRAPIPTWGGAFDIGDIGYEETYVEDKRAKTVRPGVRFHLKFSPDPKVVDAEEIAFVQAVTTTRNNQPHAISPIEEKRSIPAGDIGEGMHIDKFRSQKSPFIKDQTGAHFSDKKTVTTGDAEMIDTPGFQIWDTDSAEMTFTTSAVATKGKQANAFYGAVQWGWTRKEKQRPVKIPMTASASPLPGGSLFKTIAVLWDKSTTSGGDKTEHLPTVDVKFTTKTTHVALDPAKPGAKRGFDLPINTRVEVTETKDPTNKGWQRVIVISGTQRGKIGWISDPLSDTESFIPKSNRKP